MLSQRTKGYLISFIYHLSSLSTQEIMLASLYKMRKQAQCVIFNFLLPRTLLAAWAQALTILCNIKFSWYKTGAPQQHSGEWPVQHLTYYDTTKPAFFQYKLSSQHKQPLLIKFMMDWNASNASKTKPLYGLFEQNEIFIIWSLDFGETLDKFHVLWTKALFSYSWYFVNVQEMLMCQFVC